MGCIYLNGVPYGDEAQPVAYAAPKPCGDAMRAAIEALTAGARRSTIAATKSRARVYIAKPWQLDMAWPGLSNATGENAALIAAHLADSAPRMVGFGGEITMINQRAIKLYARALRLAERRDLRKAA